MIQCLIVESPELSKGCPLGNVEINIEGNLVDSGTDSLEMSRHSCVISTLGKLVRCSLAFAMLRSEVK